MRHEVFNNTIGSPVDFGYSSLTTEEELDIISGLFEQLLIFDRIVITTNRVNFALAFLIKNLGINTVEKLFEYGYLKIMIWSPVLVTGRGRELEDGSMDLSVIYGQSPVSAGVLSPDDLDPEKSIHKALSHFQLHRERKRIFSRKVAQHYLIPEGMQFSTESAKLVLAAYTNNNLTLLGLPYEKQPDQLDLAQRDLLLDLGQKVLETAVLSQYNLKSYENYDHVSILKTNLQNIGKAYKIANNTATLFDLEGLPNLKQLFIQEKLQFDDVFKIRHLSNAKYYRRWINQVGENYDAKEITKEYLNEIKGKNNFFDTTEGKFLKNLGVFGASGAIGAAIAGPAGALAGMVSGGTIDYGLGLLDTFFLENLLKGNNPSMFIEDIKNKIE